MSVVYSGLAKDVLGRTVAATAVQSSMCNLEKGRSRDHSLALRRRMARKVRVPHTLRSSGARVSLRLAPAISCLDRIFVEPSNVSMASIGFNFVAG